MKLKFSAIIRRDGDTHGYTWYNEAANIVNAAALFVEQARKQTLAEGKLVEVRLVAVQTDGE